MWMLLCAALALRLLTDLATPFMPGAFMLEDSVTAASRAPSVRAVDEAAQPAAPPRAVAVARLASPAVRAVRAPDVSLSWFPPRQPRRLASPRSDTADDPLRVALASA